ncbi:reactive intermediate/imine deaminase [Hamadaea flava]|uniref:Rid family detoxifying hydrolase n=1 Tax=Hamadaea flava TaxID=1742688 RepID=A0ABV8M0Z8_9ACTN|nr:Rid family detoxifying hydrolase [Hamadaea flava]MCP2322062.1 reactive intermediate/imine deaminase [Hamadaea flava]
MSQDKVAYSTDQAPSPAASYSQAVRKGNTVAVAGQVGLDPATRQLVEGGVAEQTRQTLTNVVAVLAAAGATMDDVIMMRVYLTSHEHFAAMNEVYQEFVQAPFPSRTTVFVGLAPGMLVEIDALAVL